MITEELDEVNEKIRNESNVKSAVELWCMCRDTSLDAIQKYVPMETYKENENLPYMTAEISKLIKKRDRVFKKRAKSECTLSKQSRVSYQHLDRNLRSNVKLFADHTIVCIAVSSRSDSVTLQKDFRRLKVSEAKWNMEFHPGKCQVLTISRKQYNLHVSIGTCHSGNVSWCYHPT